MADVALTRLQLLAHRMVRQGLTAAPDSAKHVTDVDLLDFGVQDTGPDGSAWALALRGAPTAERASCDDDLALAWTLRGAPHAYRRTDLAEIAVATSPFSDDDAAKRIFDASSPLRKAGLTILGALATVAAAQRAVVRTAKPKGEVSAALRDRLEAPFLRRCRPCNAVHAYEQPFRLAALQAGLTLDAGTAPPVMRRVTGLEPLKFARSGADAAPRFDVIRNVLRFAPGSTIADAAAVIDGAAKDVRRLWPDDVITVAVHSDAGTAERFALADDVDLLGSAPELAERTVRLLGPYDPLLQLRDRELLAPDVGQRKDLWRVIGRPGAVVANGELIASWRPRTTGKRFGIDVTPWGRLTKADRARIETEAERLANFRDRTLGTVAYS